MITYLHLFSPVSHFLTSKTIMVNACCSLGVVPWHKHLTWILCDLYKTNKQKKPPKEPHSRQNPIGTMVSLKIQESFSTSTGIFGDITLSRKINGETDFAYSVSSFFKFLETLCKWLFFTYLNLDKDAFPSPWHFQEVLSTKIKAVTFFFPERVFWKMSCAEKWVMRLNKARKSTIGL